MDLVIVILATLSCFAAGAFLLRPNVRSLFPTVAIAAYFYFVGIWCMINHIISNIWPSSPVMDYIFYSATVILALCVVFLAMTSGRRSGRGPGNQ